jgi:lysophospholipase L1-like esterase
MGDSIVANDYVGDEINEMLSRELGEEVFNAGFGGTCISNHNIEHYDANGTESLVLEELVNSIVTNDFAIQMEAIHRAALFEYYEDRLKTISQIDFNKTHTLIIEHCVNDYVLQISPKQVGENLKKTIILLKETYPALRILVSSPTYCYIEQNGQKLYCDTTELGPYVLEEYILEEQRVCEELDVIFVDNYHQDIITRETMDAYYLDGLHLNETGRQFMADNILAALKDTLAN